MSYNGFTNYDTWNIDLWLSNDYAMYVAMCNYVHRCDAQNKQPTYLDLCKWLGIGPTDETPDGVCYLGDSINTKELDILLFDGIGCESWRTYA